MAKIDITISLETPAGVPISEAVRLFTDHHNYRSTVANPNFITGVEGSAPTIPNPQTRGQFAKATIARQVAEAIKAQRKIAAEKAIVEGEEIIVN